MRKGLQYSPLDQEQKMEAVPKGDCSISVGGNDLLHLANKE